MVSIHGSESAVWTFRAPPLPSDPRKKACCAVRIVPTRRTAALGASAFEDVLTFPDGKLSSRELGREGSVPSLTPPKGTTSFWNWETVPVLRATNKVQWNGVVNRKNAKGDLKWVTRGGRVLYFTYRSQRH